MSGIIKPEDIRMEKCNREIIDVLSKYRMRLDQSIKIGQSGIEFELKVVPIDDDIGGAAIEGGNPK